MSADLKNNPHAPKNPITGMSDLMLSIQRDNERLESGEVTLDVARAKTRNNALLLKGAELSLSHRRMMRGRAPEQEIRLIEPVAPAADPKTEEPKQ